MEALPRDSTSPKIKNRFARGLSCIAVTLVAWQTIYASQASFRRDSRSQHSSNAVDGTYYIVPGGVDVIFQDGAGNEITRQIVKLLVHAHPDEFVELAILAIKAEMVKDEMGKQVATIPAALETTNKMDTKEVDAVIPVPGLLAQNCEKCGSSPR